MTTLSSVHDTKDINSEALTELIGINENIAAGNYSKSATFALGDLRSGEIFAVQLVSYETGAGAVLTPAGVLYFFKADPTISANDAALAAAAADHKNIIGEIPFTASDWESDANGAVAIALVTVPFKDISSIFAAFRLDGAATPYNALAGDDELLELSFDYFAYRKKLT